MRDASGQSQKFDEDKGFGFIKPDAGGDDVFFHVSALRDDDEISVGSVVTFETGQDRKTGRSKAVQVDVS